VTTEASRLSISGWSAHFLAADHSYEISGALGTYRSEMACSARLVGAGAALDATRRRRCALIDLFDNDLARCPRGRRWWHVVDSSAAC